MIILTQANQLVDMSGCMVQRVDQPLPSILLIQGSPTEMSKGNGVVMLYSGTQVQADAKFAALIAAAQNEDIYFSMI